ncbi:hypothetical protein [Dyadobacter psychrotolerans]|uniref:Uncharacterized protein n=1 Tax=Dyadobacter psychrotolerans TaxID=2541721 RepID=A0A4V2Z460_9BACT|nr:hypothetical protein [Dyadobacter psychrotolerans]TDE15358.1 hypothetical protein E0F88_12650 [Dyadobacter psychrotolerans]
MKLWEAVKSVVAIGMLPEENTRELEGSRDPANAKDFLEKAAIARDRAKRLDAFIFECDQRV